MGASEPHRAAPAESPAPAESSGAGAGEDPRLAAIVAEGRATRRRASRATRIAAGIVGALCAIGFVLLLLAGDGGQGGRPAAAGSAEPPRAAVRGAGCAGGLGLGLGVGLAIGFALGRRRA